MADSRFLPAWELLAALRAAPLRPWQTWLRTTRERWHPPRVVQHRSRSRRAGAQAGSATLLYERGQGRTPTIVLGGLVPDSSEQVFLLRPFLLGRGDLYCVQYPREDFSLDVICDQLSELVEDLAATPPVILAVSFGAGIALEWLRRRRAAGAEPRLAGLALISPVACVEDLVATDVPKARTLLGRALRPFLGPEGPELEGAVDRARSLFMRMFEAGAQNKAALRMLMTRQEAERLQATVAGTIRAITAAGARARVGALRAMLPPAAYFSPAALPITHVPALVLFAEKEDSVLDPASPTRFALERAGPAFFPHVRVATVQARPGCAAVQHASLIFHVDEFLGHLRPFYHRLQRRTLPLAA